jgi:hypothetical protein
MTMPSVDLTCDQVERDELDLKYLHGRLRPEQAEAFEAHFFGCDACWELVRAGQALRATRPVPAARSMRPWGLLAAAVLIGALGIGLWRAGSPTGLAVPDRLRAGPDPGALMVRALPASTGSAAIWNIVPGAASYRVRLFTRDGGLVVEREIADTSFAVARDSLLSPGPHYWQVQALDRMGGELARSGLVEAEGSSPRPAP